MLFSSFEIDTLHISLLIKIVGVAILTDIISDNLKDNGETALSNTVVLLSKFIILYMTFPVLNGIIVFCIKFINF
jgi:stage III sporulation protein AD